MSSPYDLQPQRHAPGGSVIAKPTADEAADALAADLLLHALTCVRSLGDVHLALSGGESAERLYRTLLLDPSYRAFPWKRAHVWLVGSEGGSRDAERTITELLVGHADLPEEQFHPMPASSPGAAAAYERELRECLGWRERGHDRIDFVLINGELSALGAGDDGSRLVHTGPGGTLTLGLRTINAARFIAVLGHDGPEQSGPAARIRPVGGVLRWYLSPQPPGGRGP
jgi:6-phosphogluconolactonase/glucosamine-6-phosphate isomerase/deaminase